MKDEEIYSIWTQFINNPRYSKYFKSNQEVWKETLQKLIKFIDNNKKKPTCKSKNKDEKIKLLDRNSNNNL